MFLLDYLLFSNKKELLNLYNAINDTDINIITLENILFMDRKNDLCFTINDKLVVLVEHKSSINNNMPLRFLFYIAREYEKIIDDKNIYKSNLIKIPNPEFIVLYNGKNEYPKSNKLYLSDAFYYKDNLNLELIVDVININYDVHNIILDKSNTLNGYSYFVYLVREYQKQFKTKIQTPFNSSINLDLIKDDIISSFKNIMNEFSIDIWYNYYSINNTSLSNLEEIFYSSKNNFIFKHCFIANYKSNLWQLEIYTKKDIVLIEEIL